MCILCMQRPQVGKKKKIAALKYPVPSFGVGLDWCSLAGPRKLNCMFLSSSSSQNPQSQEIGPEWTFSSVMHHVMIIFSDRILHSTHGAHF